MNKYNQNHSNVISLSPSPAATDEMKAGTPWYIFRYKILTKVIKDYFSKNSENIFFPFITVRKVRPIKNATAGKLIKGKRITQQVSQNIEYDERPCIPGYIFIHGDIDSAIKMGREVGLNPWKKRASENTNVASLSCASEAMLSAAGRKMLRSNEYYSVTHKAMVRFMQAISHIQSGVKIYDPSEIDPEQDDIVEFISGTMVGQRGYIKTQEGKAGGMVIIPMGESTETVLTGNATNAGQGSLLHFGIEASPDEYRIIQFANPVRNKDIIKRANQKVAELLKAFANGKEITEAQKKRLRGYATRYADAKMDTLTQRANQALLLYRIHTILEDDNERAEVAKHITDGVLPAFDQHIDAESSVRKAKVADRKKKFLNEIEDAERAREQRQLEKSAAPEHSQP